MTVLWGFPSSCCLLLACALSVPTTIATARTAVTRQRHLRSIGATAPKEHWTDEELWELSECTDTTAHFDINEETIRDCVWLQENLVEQGDLCDRHDIASNCRRTCGICEDTLRAVELLQKCENEVGAVVEYSHEYVTCDWIKRNRDNNPDACSMTNVVLACPVVCDYFGLGSCIRVDPVTTTGKKADTAESGQS